MPFAIYECPRCGYSTSKKSDIKTHYKRKRVCSPTVNDISIKDCLTLLQNESKNNKCKFCSKMYTRKGNLVKHQFTCDAKKEYEKKEEEIQKLKEQLESEKNKNSSTPVTNNTTNYNNCGNTYNIININSFKETNYMALKDEIIKCLKDQDEQLKVPAFEKIIDKVHFNKDYPENHNIYKPNIRDDRILTYNGEDFMVDRTAIDTILEKLEHIIYKCMDDKDEGIEYIKKLKYHLNLKQQDCDYSESTKDDIAVSLYNGRNIVKTTHKDLKKNEIKT